MGQVGALAQVKPLFARRSLACADVAAKHDTTAMAYRMCISEFSRASENGNQVYNGTVPRRQRVQHECHVSGCYQQKIISYWDQAELHACLTITAAIAIAGMMAC